MQKSNLTKVKSHMQYNWFVYIIIVVVAIVLWSALLTSITTPRGNQKLAIFMGAQQVDSQEVEEQLQPLLDQTVQLINVDYAYAYGDNFSYIFSTRGLVNTDIVILPQDYLPNEQIASCFAPIDKTLLAQYLPIEMEIEYLEYDGIAYGIRVFDGTEGILTDDITYCDISKNVSFYMFFNATSVNLGAMNTQGNSADDIALRALSILFE